MPQFTSAFTLTADPPAAFLDNFASLSLINSRNVAAGGIWEPAFWYATDGILLNDSWLVNPFNPNTQGTNVLFGQNGNAMIGCDNTPPAIAAACSFAPQVAGQIELSKTYRQLHGYFECRFKLQKVQGLGASFFLMQDATFPPELDIIEITSPAGNNNDAWLGVYTVWDMSGNIAATNFTYNGVNPGPSWDPGDFHTYGVDWQASTITWYIDRQVTFSAPTPAGYTDALFPIIQYNSGGSFAGPVTSPGSLPAFMVLDYVGIWQQRPF